MCLKKCALLLKACHSCRAKQSTEAASVLMPPQLRIPIPSLAPTLGSPCSAVRLVTEPHQLKAAHLCLVLSAGLVP